MNDLTIELENRPGALAEMGEALRGAEVSIEGGGAFVADGKGVAHFLFENGTHARQALEAVGIRVVLEREVIVQRLRQDESGQLGKLSRRMAEAGVNIEVLYSDHDHQLILVTDNVESARIVSEKWEREREEAQSASERKLSEKQERALKHHAYQLQVCWTGNHGEGTKSYKSYGRDYAIESTGKPRIEGSSDPAFRGDANRYNPEELLVASLSSCHMLWYLHLCSVNGVVVLGYEDLASGTMEESGDGSGTFVWVELNPAVTIASGSDPAKALALHEEAHRNCFIAKSVNFPVRIVPRIVPNPISE
jgi:organic hydroperoxide reductase OsmC/OhrA